MPASAVLRAPSLCDQPSGTPHGTCLAGAGSAPAHHPPRPCASLLSPLRSAFACRRAATTVLVPHHSHGSTPILLLLFLLDGISRGALAALGEGMAEFCRAVTPVASHLCQSLTATCVTAGAAAHPSGQLPSW